MNRDEMVPVGLLVPHPKNPNKMSPDKFEKLKRHILMGGNYERIVVRTLELSRRKAEHKAGKMEILAGHHRFKVLQEDGRPEVACSIWEGVTDYAAAVYLDTLNGLRGEPDAKIRSELLQEMLASSSYDRITADLPDDDSTIRKLLAMPVAHATPGRVSTAVIDSVPLTLFGSREQVKIIEAAIAAWLAIHDPESQLPNREGAALVALLGQKESKR